MPITTENWPAKLALLSLFIPTICLADHHVGQIIGIKPGVVVVRKGQENAVQLKDKVYLNDIIKTDQTGRVQIIFEDDTSVTISKNSVANMQEFAMDDKNPKFKMNVAQGFARVITGKIVEKNPKAFSVTTPEATVGIRGTIVVISTVNGQTTVFVENTNKEVFVNGVLVQPGFKLTIGDGGVPTPQPMTQEEKQNIAEASTVASNTGTMQNIDTSTLALNNNDLSNEPLVIQNTGDNDTLLIDLAGGITGVITGKVSGSLASGNLSAPSGFTGSFSFDVNISTGNVSNAAMAGGSNDISTAASFAFNLSGGSGNIGTTINGFSGTLSHGMNLGAPENLHSDTNMQFLGPDVSAVGNLVEGNYNIYSSNSSAFPIPFDSGSAIGTRTE